MADTEEIPQGVELPNPENSLIENVEEPEEVNYANPE